MTMKRALLAVALAGLFLSVLPFASVAAPSPELERAVAAFVAARDAGDADRAAHAAAVALTLGRSQYGADHPSQSYLLEALAGSDRRIAPRLGDP
jgi:hypothetical protein